jgi:hypothetical protein
LLCCGSHPLHIRRVAEELALLLDSGTDLVQLFHRFVEIALDIGRATQPAGRAWSGERI